MKRFIFYLILAIYLLIAHQQLHAQVQKSEYEDIQKLWFQIGLGLGFDKSISEPFSLYSLSPAISYQYHLLKTTVRFRLMPGADGVWDKAEPKRTIRDYGLLAGLILDKKYFSFSLSAGISYQEGNAHGKLLKESTEGGGDWGSSKHYYYEDIELNGVCYPIEIELFWTIPRKTFGAGLQFFYNINPRIDIYGFQIVIGGGSSNIGKKI
ncbi:MAG: hypothetical protein QG635_805 [Bacteroidota bacterium]|nr:hypothetical protein [Bacteroidota bacterium]